MHNLTDVTFVIPYLQDSKERRQNLYCIVAWLVENFKTHIIIHEESNTPTLIHSITLNEYATVMHSPEEIAGVFYRTKVINDAIKKVKTPAICIYDTDVIFDSKNLAEAMRLIKKHHMVFPYDGTFVDIERSYIQDGKIRERDSHAINSYGGAVFIRTLDYWNAGLESEHIVSWGPEDGERYERMKTLGYSIARVPGKCYHIEHARGINSGPKNPYTNANLKEYHKVKEMSREDLIAYTKSWQWAKR